MTARNVTVFDGPVALYLRDVSGVHRKLSLAMLFGLFAVSLQAQYALDVDAIVGFSGVFRAGSWTPVHVTISNLGQDVDGELRIDIERGDRFGPDRFTVSYRRDAELVSGASKAFSFVVPIDTTVYPLRIVVTDGEAVAHDESFELLGRSVPARLAIVLARRPNLDFLLPLYNSRDRRVLDVVYPLPSYLPEEWQGYGAVDLIVIHDARLQELTERQVVALRDWVASGGRLVVSGGAHFGPADAQTLAPLADFATTGITITTVAEAGLLEAGLPVDPSERTAQVVATSFARAGSRLERIELGRGDVVVLPFDYANLVRVAPLSSIALWNSLLATDRPIGEYPTELRRRVFETDILANQLSLPLYDFPSRLLVLGLAASYVVGLAGIAFWLSRGKNRLRRWLGLPGIVVLAAIVTLVGHAALTESLQPVEALELSVERAELVPGGGYAIVTRETTLFSRQVAEYTVRYPGAPLLVPMEQEDHLIERSRDASAQTLAVGRWGYANNVALQVVPLDITSRVAAGDDYLEVEFSNDSRRSVRGLVAISNGFPQRVGDLFPGTVIEHVVEQPAQTEFERIDWIGFVPDDALAENRARLLSDLARRQRFANGNGNRPAPSVIFVGWTDRPLLGSVVEPEFEMSVELNALIIPVVPEGGES